MAELLFHLIAGLVQVLFEAFLEIAGEALFDGIGRVLLAAFEPDNLTPPLATVGFVLLGGIAGALSLLIFPSRLSPATRFHGMSLILSPLITGSVMSLIGSSVRRHGKKPTRIESFGYGFAFALGMSAARFFFVR